MTLLHILSIVEPFFAVGFWLLLILLDASLCLMDMPTVWLLLWPLVAVTFLIALLCTLSVNLLLVLFFWLLDSPTHLSIAGCPNVVALAFLQAVVYRAARASWLEKMGEEQRQWQQDTTAWDNRTDSRDRLSRLFHAESQRSRARKASSPQLANDRAQYEQWKRRCDIIFDAGQGRLEFPPSWPRQESDCLSTDKDLLDAQYRVLRRLFSSADDLLATFKTEAARWDAENTIFSVLERTEEGKGSLAMAEELQYAMTRLCLVESGCRPT